MRKLSLKNFLTQIRRTGSTIARRTMPPLLFDALLHMAGREQYRTLNYQGVQTWHNTRPLHVGRFAESYEKNQVLNPYVPLNRLRYSLYNVCTFAALCRNVPGDFLCAGISYGVAPHLIYDFVKFERLGKLLHLIDPFTGTQEGTNEPYKFYNTDLECVRAQYPADAPIEIHRGVIPQLLPLPGVEELAFVFLNTGDLAAEIASLPILFEQLRPKGAIVVEQYGIGQGNFEYFDPVFAKLGVEPIWLPSGQCVVIK